MTTGYTKANRPQAERYLHLDTEAFGGEPEVWIARLDALIDRLRVIPRGDDGDVAAGLTLFDVGQWFGGRRVRCRAIGGVVTAPAHRGQGVGQELMLAMLREARAEGVPLSTLYASTPTFYRKLGYEPAGWAWWWECDTAYWPCPTGAGEAAEVVPFAPDDPRVRGCYRAWASAQPGPLDRDDLLWSFKLDPPQNEAGKRFRYRFDFEGRTEGYVALGSDRSHALCVEDHAVTTPRARDAVTRFLHGHRSVNGKAAWFGGPNDPLRLMIPENRARLGRRTEPWLLRVVDPVAALRERGYAAIDADAAFEVVDDAMPENAGPISLKVRRGEPEVRRGGAVAMRMDARGLAALYTGQASAEELAAAGLAEGPADALAAATAAFAGPGPFMVDKF